MKKELIKGEVLNFYLKSKEGAALFTLKGNSMYPTFKDNWQVKVKPIDVNGINFGDVVVFAQKELICHRIIGKFKLNRRLYFIHKGDSQKFGSVFEEKDLVGKVYEVFDINEKMIEEYRWKTFFHSSLKTRLLGNIYLFLFLIKRLLFGKKRNKLIYQLRNIFWKLYHSLQI